MKDWLRNEHTRVWTGDAGARHTKIFCGSPSTETSTALLNLGRADIKRVIEAVTDHCSLNKHLFDIGYADNPRCLCNHGEETGFHVITECGRYRLHRKRIFDHFELPMSDLKLEHLKIDRLAEFLRLTRRFP